MNSDYTPIGVLPMSSLHWHDAMRAVCLNSVRVHHSYENWVVHSPSQSIPVPSVVVARDYVKIRRFVGFSSDMVHLRDGYRCAYCSGKFTCSELTMDHVVPKSKGGKLTFDNTVSACAPCNCRRGNNTRIQPKWQPTRPTYHELVSKRRQYPVSVPHESWIEFIGWDPRLVTVDPPVSMPGYNRDALPLEHDAEIRELLLQQA